MKWDLWVDFDRTDGDRLTHTHRRHLRPGINPAVGSYLVVGNEEAEPAIAEVVSIDVNGIALVRVLPGPAVADHRKFPRADH